MFIKAIVEIEYSYSTGRQKIKNKIKSTGTVRVMSICYFKTNIGTSVLGPTLDDILYGDFNYDLIQFGYTPVHIHTCVHTFIYMISHMCTVLHVYCLL